MAGVANDGDSGGNGGEDDGPLRLITPGEKQQLIDRHMLEMERQLSAGAGVSNVNVPAVGQWLLDAFRRDPWRCELIGMKVVSSSLLPEFLMYPPRDAAGKKARPVRKPSAVAAILLQRGELAAIVTSGAGGGEELADEAGDERDGRAADGGAGDRAVSQDRGGDNGAADCAATAVRAALASGGGAFNYGIDLQHRQFAFTADSAGAGAAAAAARPPSSMQAAGRASDDRDRATSSAANSVSCSEDTSGVLGEDATADELQRRMVEKVADKSGRRVTAEDLGSPKLGGPWRATIDERGVKQYEPARVVVGRVKKVMCIPQLIKMIEALKNSGGLT